VSVIVVAGRWSMLQLFKYNRFFSMFLFLPLPLPCLNILFWGRAGGIPAGVLFGLPGCS